MEFPPVVAGGSAQATGGFQSGVSTSFLHKKASANSWPKAARKRRWVFNKRPNGGVRRNDIGLVFPDDIGTFCLS